MRVVPAEVVEKFGNLVIYSRMEFAMPMSSADEMGRNLVKVTDFRSVWICVFLERLATNVTLNRIVVLLLLCARQSLHWKIVFKIIDALSFPIGQSVLKLGERIFIDRILSTCVHCLNGIDQYFACR